MRRFARFLLIAFLASSSVAMATWFYINNDTPTNTISAGDLFDAAWNRQLYDPTPIANHDPRIIWVYKNGQRFSIEARKTSFYGHQIYINSYGGDEIRIYIVSDESFWVIESASHDYRTYNRSKKNDMHLAYFKKIVEDVRDGLALCTIPVQGWSKPTCPK